MAHPTSTAGGRLKTRREDLGLTRRNLAETCNVTESTVYKWETNQHPPCLSPDQLKALLTLLQWSLDDFQGWQKVRTTKRSRSPRTSKFELKEVAAM
jgi:transcriptional regulator with XRE-family HTH domain